MSESLRNLPLRLASNYYLDLDNLNTLGTEPFMGWEEYQAGDLLTLDEEAYDKWSKRQMPRSVAQKLREKEELKLIADLVINVFPDPLPTTSDLLDE